MKSYIFDIDGTLADCSHRLHLIKNEPKNWKEFFSRVLDDKPIKHMVDLCKILIYHNYHVTFVSGRSEECRDDTERWLVRNVSIYLPLYMRKKGDHRDDDILKIELLSELRADGIEPIMVFDDRTRVVNAWRAEGIPCVQVAPGDF